MLDFIQIWSKKRAIIRSSYVLDVATFLDDVVHPDLASGRQAAFPLPACSPSMASFLRNPIEYNS